MILVLVGGLGLSGCSVVKKISTVVHAVHGNKATINTFSAKLSAQPSDFEVKYTTTGAAPASIVYALDQASGGLMFTDTPSGSSGPSVDIIVNSSGEYACTPGSSSTAADSCERLPPEDKANEAQLFEIYTPAHWVTFLKDFSIAAGFAGDKVTSSTMTVNGFALSCVDFNASGVPGTSTICSTAQGLLGYVQVASDATSFEITSYSSSPAASLFELPPGAKVTTVQSPTTTT